MSTATLTNSASAHTELPLPAAERVADALRDQIIEGALSSGVRLAEELVAERLDVSRNTVREAFLILASEGLVVRRANRGVFVAEATAELVRDLYAVRLFTEPAAVLWGTLTPERLGRMRRASERASAAAEAGDIRAMRSANQDFHREIVGLTESPRTQRWFATRLAEMWLAFNAIGEQRDFHLPYVARNRGILESLEAGDRGAAAEELRRYLEEARDDLLARLAEAMDQAGTRRS